VAKAAKAEVARVAAAVAAERAVALAEVPDRGRLAVVLADLDLLDLRSRPYRARRSSRRALFSFMNFEVKIRTC